MSESQTVKVPLELPQPAQSQERPAPEWARKSLHAVKMPRREVQLEPEWVNNGPNVEVRWREAEQRAEPEAPQPYQQQGVNYMEQNQPDNNNQQQPGAAQPPDPMSYDFFSPEDTARFHQDNAAYYQQVVDQRVQAHLQPHMSALQEAELRRDYNAAFERYGSDDNFQECMQVALENCTEAQARGKKFSIIEAYQAANDKTAARPGQRGNAHLPAEFRGKNGIKSLGRIMAHNQQTGRAKFEKRGW